MSKDYKFFFGNTMKNARKTYKGLGMPLIIFLVLFAGIYTYVIGPLLSKLWGLALMTTPDGFISNANLINSLLKSPWIIPIGLALIFIYAVFSLWQASAIFTAVYYSHDGQKIKIWDLIKISIKPLGGRKFKNSWFILIYALVIIPLTNIYQTSNMVSAFIVPEHIHDFIMAKPILAVLFVIACLFLLFVALRWFFVMPSFIFKKNSFKESRKESRTLTSKTLIRNWINMEIHSLIEMIRICLIPLILIMVPAGIAYLATKNMQYATNIFSTIGISRGVEIIENATGTLTQISILAFIVELYFKKLRDMNMDESTTLPDLQSESKLKISVNMLQLICSAIFAVLLLGGYLITVNMAQKDNAFVLSLFKKTEIIAHKGYSSEAPENTMPAFELADQSEAVTYIELDVWSTKDGIPVVTHNRNIYEATGVDKNVYECTYDEIKNLPATYAMSPTDFPTATIPTLEEVIKKYAACTPILIEIKGFDQDPELSAKVVELMKKYGTEYESRVQSGNYAALKAVKQIDPKIKCGLILGIVTGYYFDLPYADFFTVEHNFVSQDVVDQLERIGKEVYVWTVNFSTSAEKLKFMGCHGLITDYPDDINEYVSDENNLIYEATIKSWLKQFGVSAAREAIINFESGEY